MGGLIKEMADIIQNASEPGTHIDDTWHDDLFTVDGEISANKLLQEIKKYATN